MKGWYWRYSPELLHHGPFEGQELELGGMILGLSSFSSRLAKSHRVVMPVVGLLEEYGAHPSPEASVSSRNGLRKSANTRTGASCTSFSGPRRLEEPPGLIPVLRFSVCWLLLQQVIQGFSYLSIPLNESPEESGHSSKSSYFCVSLRQSHLRYRSQVGLTGLHAVGQYLMA